LCFFCEGVVGFIREDDVIEERDIEDVAGLAELVRLVDVSMVVELYRWFSYSE